MVAERQSIKLADFAAKLEDGGSPYQALAREAKVRKQLLEEPRLRFRWGAWIWAGGVPTEG